MPVRRRSGPVHAEGRALPAWLVPLVWPLLSRQLKRHPGCVDRDEVLRRIAAGEVGAGQARRWRRLLG